MFMLVINLQLANPNRTYVIQVSFDVQTLSDSNDIKFRSDLDIV